MKANFGAMDCCLQRGWHVMYVYNRYCTGAKKIGGRRKNCSRKWRRKMRSFRRLINIVDREPSVNFWVQHGCRVLGEKMLTARALALAFSLLCCRMLHLLCSASSTLQTHIHTCLSRRPNCTHSSRYLSTPALAVFLPDWCARRAPAMSVRACGLFPGCAGFVAVLSFLPQLSYTEPKRRRLPALLVLPALCLAKALLLPLPCTFPF